MWGVLGFLARIATWLWGLFSPRRELERRRRQEAVEQARHRLVADDLVDRMRRVEDGPGDEPLDVAATRRLARLRRRRWWP